MITRKDFKAIAEDLKRLRETNEKQVFVNLLCKHFKILNPRFDEERFREASKNGGDSDA